jgi:hypothetical protein
VTTTFQGVLQLVLQMRSGMRIQNRNNQPRICAQMGHARNARQALFAINTSRPPALRPPRVPTLLSLQSCCTTPKDIAVDISDECAASIRKVVGRTETAFREATQRQARLKPLVGLARRATA